MLHNLNICLLIQASRMHGWIRSALINLFEHEFVEGRLLDIQNFVVRPYHNYEINRCFTADKHMLLTPITAIVPVQQILPNFLMHVFCCIPLNFIPDHGEQESYLIGKFHTFNTVVYFLSKSYYVQTTYYTKLADVVGIIQSVQNFNSYTDRNGIEQSSVKFVLANNE